MRAVKQKLKSRRGAAVLYALLLFLVCALVAAGTLTAAYHTASRAAAVREAQQDYLAVSSAAELVKSAVGGRGMTVERVRTTHHITDENGEVTGSYTETDYFITDPYDGDFALVGNYVFQRFQGNSATRTYDLSFQLDGQDALENVAGTLTIDDDFGVSVLLYNKEGKGNAISLTFTAGRADNTTGGGDVSTRTLAVTWGAANVSATTVQ